MPSPFLRQEAFRYALSVHTKVDQRVVEEDITAKEGGGKGLEILSVLVAASQR